MRYCITLLCVSIAHAQPSPKFSDYPATVRRAANFAGHYEVSTKACRDAEGYTEITIKDVVSGTTHGGGCYWWGYGAYGRKDLPHGIKYRANSTLLTISGCREVPERACATFYYAFKDDVLTLLRLIPFKPPIVLE